MSRNKKDTIPIVGLAISLLLKGVKQVSGTNPPVFTMGNYVITEDKNGKPKVSKERPK